MLSLDLTQITFDADSECLELLKRVQELNGDPTESVREVFKTAMKEYIRLREKRQGLRDKAQRIASRAPEVQSADATAKNKQTETRSRYISMDLRRAVFKRAKNRCEYFDDFSKKHCESRSRLEIDHIIPFARGGRSEENNLRVVCRTHNLLFASREYGERSIGKYLRN